MKKFIVLSAIVGMAGLGVGFANRQSDSEPSTTVAAAAPETATTAPVADAPASSTTIAPKATAKPTAAKVATTTTRPRAAAVPTPTTVVTTVTTTTAAPVTTTTTALRFRPACSLAVSSPTVAPGESVVVRLTSNMPYVSAKVSLGDYVKADSAGSATWTIKAPTAPGPVALRTSFVFAESHQFIGSVCSSSFTVAS